MAIHFDNTAPSAAPGDMWWTGGKLALAIDDLTSIQWVQISSISDVPMPGPWDFPDAPTEGQGFTPVVGGATLTWNGQIWTFPSAAGGGGIITIADAAPTGTVPNTLWWDSDSGDLFVNYNDMDSTQWVQINTKAAATTGSGGIADAPADGTEYLRKDNAWVNPTATGGFTQTDADLLYEPLDSAYTKAEGDAKYFPFAGGTITGNVTVNGVATFTNHVNVGTAAALRNTSLHGYLLVTDDQQLYLDGGGTKNTSSKGILLRKSATESTILHGRICSREDDYSQGIIEFQLNNQAGGVVGSVTFNGGVSLERWAWFNAMSVQCADVVETSTAADKTEIRDVQKTEVDTAWKTLKPKKFRRKSTEDDSVGPLRYGFVMEDMADDLVKKRPPSAQGNASGYSIGQVLALTVARLKEVEAELAALKAKVE